ncbi:U3 small nucleolar RNA-associated protein 18 homolog wicked [Anticarsia gemmatalis]|uniref:U3 small nucleolar RNA-associated protein 18 homolog wicked n=1 Tax=Anticarsia gemmatalis TaxID=129554 RepID=UPI003F76E6F0
MKRKSSNLHDEEAKVSQLLFNKSKNFIENLNAKSKDEVHADFKPAWIDEDDENFQANIIPNVNSKSLYTEKLKLKYETLMGTPSWAALNKRSKDNDEQDEILRTVGHLHKSKSKLLPKDFIEIKKFPQINAATKNEGSIISCIEFHPKISAALVAGNSGAVSLFSIGGDENNKIHSFDLQKWNISAAQFTPDGSEAFIAAKSSHTYCVYNLVKAEPKLIQLPKVVKRPNIFQLSSDGKYIVTCDGFEEVYLICSASKELLKSLKHNSNIASVAFNQDCSQLYCYSIDGQITIWDLSTYRVLKKFYDNGCVTASCLTTSPCGKLLAAGSGEGIVNIYQTDNLTTSEPLPFKVISNLTTKITTLKFNATTEILAASSSYYPNAAKLVHIPSYHVFANFPNQSNNVNHVNTMSFSPNSGYMALGNNKGCAYLYRLKYYKNY